MKSIPSSGLVAVWLATLAFAPVLAGPGGGTAFPTIQKAYDDAAFATSLKYVPGMLAGRATDFECFAPNGDRMDLHGERARFQRFLAHSLTAQETAKVLSFQQLDARHVRCVVHDRLEVVRLSPKREPYKVVLESDSQDDWEATSDGWKERACHIRKQSVHGEKASVPEASQTPVGGATP